MAYPRPSTINYASLAETVKAANNQAIQFLISRGKMNEAEAKKILAAADPKNARPVNYFGESNLQAGDIICFPSKAEVAANLVPNTFMGTDAQTGEQTPRASYGLKVLTVDNKKRDFFLSALFSSAIDNQNGQTEVRSEMPDELRNVITGGATQTEQYELLCEYMADKALKVAEKKAVQTPNSRNGKPINRSVYKFEVLLA